MESILIEHFKSLNFTKSQNKIAQYMIEHEYDLCRMSLMDVAKAVGVSDASVLRFVRVIGFDGYNAFKEKLYEKLAEQAEFAASSGKTRLRDRMEGRPDAPDNLSIQSLASEAGHVVEQSLLQNPMHAYRELIYAIKHSRYIYVGGARGTIAVSEHFARCLRFVCSNVIFLSSNHDLHAALSGASAKDLFIYFCVPRFYEADVRICQAAQTAGTPICLITNRIPSPLSKFAQYILIAKASERTFFNSMLGMLALAECLLTCLSEDDKGSLQERLDRFDRNTEEERLF